MPSRADVAPAATSVAPFARRTSTHTTLKRLRAAQRVACAGLVAATAAAWVNLLDLRAFPSGIAIPAVVALTAAAVFARKPWLSVLPRAALWASLFCGGSGALVATTSREEHTALVLLAVAAVAGLVSLGRFARSIGGMRPLLLALVVISVADAATTGLLATFVVIGDSASKLHTEMGPLLAVGGACLANVTGLFFILRNRRFAPHLIGNGLVAILNAFDVAHLHPVHWLLAGPAALQVLLALAQRLPRMSSAARRNGERVLRGALVAAAVVVATSALWR